MTTSHRFSYPSPRRAATTRSAWPDVQAENWFETAGNDPGELQVWCYTDRLSYVAGETVRFHVNTTAPVFDLAIVRDGAVPREVWRREGLAGRFSPTPDACSVEGCGWPVALELEVPADWASGGYLVTTSAAGGDGRVERHDHVFLVAPGPGAQRKGRLLLLAATGTWLAYNDWGGSNHYEGITGPEGDRPSPVVSIERPWSRGFCRQPAGAPRAGLRDKPPMGGTVRYPHVEWAYANGFSKKYASAGWASYERPFVAWAEAQGYAVDIASHHDLQHRPGLLDGYGCVVCVGHDEYWTWEGRDAIDAYVEAGGRVARFAGNFMWQVRHEDDGRRQVCYKYWAREQDPLRDGADTSRLTSAWDDPLVGRPGATTFGLNALRGVYVRFGLCAPRAPGGFTIYRPEHWSLAGTDLYFGDVFGSEAAIFSYEVDGLDYTVVDGLPRPSGADGAPEGLEIVAMGLATLVEEDHGHSGERLFIRSADAAFVARLRYGEATAETIEKVRRGNGMMVSFAKGKGEVFHAGTTQWVAGLIARDPVVERITCNVLDRFLGRGTAAS